MTPESGLKAAASAARAILAARDGHPIDAAAHAIEAALELVPEPVVQRLISEHQAQRQNAIAELAEDAKFGKKRLNLEELSEPSLSDIADQDDEGTKP